jgi:hypothetical protein
MLTGRKRLVIGAENGPCCCGGDVPCEDYGNCFAEGAVWNVTIGACVADVLVSTQSAFLNVSGNTPQRSVQFTLDRLTPFVSEVVVVDQPSSGSTQTLKSTFTASGVLAGGFLDEVVIEHLWRAASSRIGGGGASVESRTRLRFAVPFGAPNALMDYTAEWSYSASALPFFGLSGREVFQDVDDADVCGCPPRLPTGTQSSDPIEVSFFEQTDPGNPPPNGAYTIDVRSINQEGITLDSVTPP